ncbi:MAG: portal protein [Gammaproteobacteria bacterium]|nr:MAG: portal protein [Gammaproteobacteria bacterium]
MKTTLLPIDPSPVDTEKAAETEQKVLEEALVRFKRAYEYEEKNRDLAEDDIDFRHGNQWPADIRRERESDDRPCLTFNKMEERIDQVTGDQRQGKAAIIIHPAESNSDTKGENKAGTKDYTLSQTMNGLIRSIEQNSDAQIAYNTGADHAAGHGFGYWRIVTEWDAADPFSQVIRIKRIKNSFSVYLDPDIQEPHGGDANWGFVSSMMSRGMFEARWPDKDTASWDFAGSGDEYDYWYQDQEIRIVEYFRKIPVTKIAVRMSSGSVYYVDDEQALENLKVKSMKDGDRIQETREAEVPKIEWFKLTAREFLEKPREFPSFYIPIIRVVGKELNVRGYDFYRGVIRHAKDAQRMYNFNRTAQIEQTALQPKVPFLATPDQIESFDSMWDRANKDNLPYLLYSHIDGVPMPQRVSPPIPSQAHMINALSDDADMDATTGMYKATRGEPSNEKSGKAIRERKSSSDVSSYAYHDNLNLSLKQTGRILVDMIPRIYDTQRIVRVMTPEDTDDFVELNKTVVNADGTTRKVNDLGAGRYDVRVQAGPSYTTLREESRESMMAFAQALPNIAPLISDLIAENMDWPKADAIAERLKKTLPPGIADDKDGKEPEVTPQMVEQAIQEAVQATQEELDNKLKIMEAETKIMAAESKADTDEFKALTDRIETMQSMVMDSEQIKDLVAQSIAELLQVEQGG